MVRRTLRLALGVALLLSGACSSGEDDSAARLVCETRDRTQLATSGQPVSVDQYPDIVNGLEAATKVAPPEIKPDFVLVHKLLKPFVEALVKANGDTNLAAQDPEFQKLVTAVNTDAANASAERIRKYYEKHC